MTITYRLHTGELVSSRDGSRPKFYMSLAQAEQAASKIQDAQAFKRGTSYLVRIPDPQK